MYRAIIPEKLRNQRLSPELEERINREWAELFEKGQTMDINAPLLREKERAIRPGPIWLGLFLASATVTGFIVLALWDTIAVVWDYVKRLP